MSRELAHASIGAPDTSPTEVAERMFAFMSEHGQHWETLREAGASLLSSMPYTMPWALGDATAVDSQHDCAIAALESMLPLGERVHPAWWAAVDPECQPDGPGEEHASAPRSADDVPQANDSTTTATVSCASSGVTAAECGAEGTAGIGGMADGEEGGAGGPIKRTSEFRGVSRRYGRWKARIKQNGHDLVIGDYDNELDAARAYDRKARALHGEKAMLNFPGVE